MTRTRRYAIRFTDEGEADLLRLYDFLLEKDVRAAERAISAIRRGIQILRFSPFSCRKVSAETTLLRELLIPFGASGYVVLFAIEPPATVTIVAARHQREDDYH